MIASSDENRPSTPETPSSGSAGEPSAATPGGQAATPARPVEEPPAPLASPPREELPPREEEEDFAALFAESEAAAPTRQRPQVGRLVKGRVVVIGRETAFVAIGAKSEAVLDLAEFRDQETGELHLAVGDLVEATVTDDGGRSGSIVMKRTLGRGGHVPGELEQAFEHGIAVEGSVTAQNKGGFDVQIAGQRAFCPASQMDLRRSDGAQWVGQRLRFQVTKIEGGGRNIVVSRRLLLERELAAQAAETWARLEVGAVVAGTVTSLRDFGAFIDLGGIEGMVHVSELGYGRVGHPSEALQVGQQVEAQIVKLEPAGEGGRARVGLSIRALTPDPWSVVAERYPVGTSVRGTVRRLESFGAFVELERGLDGLVHVSRMALDRRIPHPKHVVSIGDEVEVMVETIDQEKRRIGLSMIEAARRQQDEAQAHERRETDAAIAATRTGRSFGTFRDLLGRSRNKKG